MKTLKKKNFKKEYKPKLDELIDFDGAPITGDKKAAGNAEVETGPIEKPFDDDSDYVKGMSTTTDRKRKNTSQGSDYRNAYGVGGQGPYSHLARSRGIRLVENENSKIHEENMKKMVEDLLSNKRDTEFVEKNNKTIPDINQLKDKPTITGKVNELINAIKDNSLSSDEIGVVLNHITKVLSPQISSQSIKKQIFKSLTNA